MCLDNASSYFFFVQIDEKRYTRMDKRCDYVQKFLAEWELQNKLFEIMKPHRTFMTDFLNRKEND